MGPISLHRIANICAKYNSGDYYVEELIPEKTLYNARGRLSIPANEYIIAILDRAPLQSGKTGLAISECGIYWRNIWVVKTIRNKLNWGELAAVEVRRKGLFDIEIGSGNILDMSGSMFKKEHMVSLLKELQHYIISTMEETTRQPSTNSNSPAPVSEAAHAPIAGAQSPHDTLVATAADEQTAGSSSASLPLDFNRATEDELLGLPGIGLSAAKQIVQERETIGGFHSAEQVGARLNLKPHQIMQLKKQAAFHPLPAKPRNVRVVDY